MRELSEVLEDAQKSAKGLLDLLKEAHRANEQLKKQLAASHRKNKALEELLQTIRIKRARDRETIAQWQAQLKEAGYERVIQSSLDPDEPLMRQEALNEDEAEEDLQKDRGAGTENREAELNMLAGADLAETHFNPQTAPSQTEAVPFPLDSQSQGLPALPALLSQRVLPTSIDVSDPIEIEQQRRQSESSILSSSPPRSEDGSRKRRALDSYSSCEERLEWLRMLVNMNWHPSDFKYSDEPLNSRHDGEPFHCPHGRCGFCREGKHILENLGALVAESHAKSGLRPQETPAGFWRVDYLNSSQMRADNRENEELQLAEGKQRLAMTLWGNQFTFRDRIRREQADLYMV